ncbi:pyruvate ferredoxin oxidoreductase, alpha subunit, partial [mine drainage metagenome]
MFSRKGESVVEGNIKVAELGYNFAGVNKSFTFNHDSKKRYVLDGNSALSLGAFASGCKFYAAYPMTPASSILHWFAQHQNRGAVFKQTEDEIAAINMTIGASSAGVRAMCGTSGGGFSLMVEGVGLAGMLEVPIVVVESQRTGPSTGLPTKTEQADLLFVMHASQGEFPRIVVAPRDINEAFYLTSNAFNLADRYQCPVIILMDLFISEHIESI